MKETALQQRTAAELELISKQQELAFLNTSAGQALKQFELAQRMGQMFSQATIVPDVYKGNVANCAVAADMAMRMGLPPVMVMQNLYVVHGNPAWSSKFLIACIKGCGRFTTLEYRMKDNVAQDSDDYGCRCVAYDVTDTKKEHPLYGPWVTWKMVKAEGWLNKNGSKWKTMPELMFRYRAAAFWQRLYAPELAMGINTVEEAYDSVQPAEQVAYVDVSAQAEPAPVKVTEEQVAEALEALAQADTTEAARAVKNKYADVYEGSDMFRDALIDQFDRLRDAEAQAQDQQQA